MEKGQVITGEFGSIVIRQKADVDIELGELLITKAKDGSILLQVYDVSYASQISQQNLELISGMMLEEGEDFEFMDPELRNYTMALAKNILYIQGSNARVCKTMPSFFSKVREVKSDDLQFLTKPENSLYIGNLRSGSKTINTKIYLDGSRVFTEHVLIPASTGKGKSNLTSCMLFDAVDKDYCGILVLDPHDEYYGRNSIGLKDHPKKENVVYYSLNPPAGARTLKINIECLRPEHFNGSADWSGPQREALIAYYRTYNDSWIDAIMMDKPLEGSFHEGTLGVVRRRISILLSLDLRNEEIKSSSVFDTSSGSTTIKDMATELEKSRIVVVDTSNLSSSVEILLGSMIAGEVLRKYKRHKANGKLKSMPTVSIVIEEAPRVLGKDVLLKGPNIFSTIAREGRKFKVGLIAITQLPSLIPREILANMNTKIIFGIEMAPERQAIIDSASQDLSTDGRNIASLDKGEAIITSNFTKFAVPIKVPYFPDFVKDVQNRLNLEKHLGDIEDKAGQDDKRPGQSRIRKNYSGVKLG